MWLIRRFVSLKQIFFLSMYKNEYICSINCRSMGQKWCWSYRIWWWNMDKSKTPWKVLTELNIILENLKKWDAKYKNVLNIDLVESLLKIVS